MKRAKTQNSRPRAERSPADLARAIRKLPADRSVVRPGVWYRTQKEHWLGWLKHYNSPGAYGRKVTRGRSAKFVYNHVLESKMLEYLIDKGGVKRSLVTAAKQAAERHERMQSKSRAIRAIVPWDMVERALWK